LDAMNGGKVVVLDFAQLQKAKATNGQCLLYAQLGMTAGSSMQHAGAKTQGARKDWSDLLFTAFGRIVDQQVDGDISE
jgi:hypothetical protein